MEQEEVMSYTYHKDFIAKVNELDSHILGVKLAKHCIANNISVVEISKILGASRMTIYRWFTGEDIRKKNRLAVKAYLDSQSS
jgi:DNA invertase Pin-like site-specific DNA recombinase